MISTTGLAIVAAFIERVQAKYRRLAHFPRGLAKRLSHDLRGTPHISSLTISCTADWSRQTCLACVFSRACLYDDRWLPFSEVVWLALGGEASGCGKDIDARRQRLGDEG